MENDGLLDPEGAPERPLPEEHTDYCSGAQDSAVRQVSEEEDKEEGKEEGKEEAGKEKKSGLERLAELFKTLVSLLTSFAVLASVPFIFVVAWLQTRENVVLIDPIEVPKNLREQGYTSNSVAQRLSVELDRIQRRSQPRSNLRLLTPTWEKNDIQVPISGLSVSAVVRFFGEPFGYEEQHISGEMLGGDAEQDDLRSKAPDRNAKTENIKKHEDIPVGTPVQLVLHLTGKGDSLVTSSVENTRNTEKLFEDGAIQIAGMINPYMLASYYFQIEFKNRDFFLTERWIKFCIVNRPAADKARALALWGTILNEKGNLAAAAEKFQQASEYGDTVEVRLGWANTLNDLGDYTNAIGNYRRAIQLDPSAPQPHNGLGNALSQLGRTEEARREFESAIQADPQYIWAYINLGWLFSDEGDRAEGIKRFETAAKYSEIQSFGLDPSISGHAADATTEVFDEWGTALLGMGDTAKAIEKFSKSLDLDPNDYVALAGIGDALSQSGKYEAAIEKYKLSLEKRHSYWQAENSLGDALGWLGRYDEAINMYRGAIKHNKGIVAPLIGLAKLLQLKGDFRGAQEQIKIADNMGAANPGFEILRASIFKISESSDENIRHLLLEISRFPMNSFAYSDLADSLQSKGNFLAARKLNKQSVLIAQSSAGKIRIDEALIDGWQADKYSAWARGLFSLQRYKEMQLPISLAKKLARSNWDIAGYEAAAFAADHQFEKAESAYLKELELSKRYPDVVLDYADYLFSRQSYVEAKALYREVVQRYPVNGRAHIGLGSSLLALGRFAAARRELEQGGQAFNADPWRLIRLGEAARNLGDFESAADDYRLASKVSADDVSVHLAVANAFFTMNCNREGVSEDQLVRVTAYSPLLLREGFGKTEFVRDLLLADGDALRDRVADRNTYLRNLRVAKARYLEAENIDPSDYEIPLRIANLFFERAIFNDSLADFDQMQFYFNKAMKISPKSAEILINWANALKSIKRNSGMSIEVGEILSKYDLAIKLDPNNPAGYSGRGEALAYFPSKNEDFDSAASDFTRVTILRPGWPLAYEWLAEIQRSRNSGEVNAPAASCLSE